MIIDHQNRKREWSDLSGDVLQQGFKYGDVFFESIRYDDGEVALLDFHEKRFQATNIFFDLKLSENALRNAIDLISQHIGNGTYKIRFNYFRTGDAMYYGGTLSSNYFLEVSELQNNIVPPLKLNFFDEVRLSKSELAGFKTNNCAVYNFARRKLVDSSADELILLDQNNQAIETSFCNVFWIKDRNIFTTDLSSSGVKGVFRDYLMNELKVIQKSVQSKELLDADEIFLTNAVRGIIPAFIESHQSHQMTYELKKTISVQF